MKPCFRHHSILIQPCLILLLVLLSLAVTAQNAAADSYVQGLYVESCLVASTTLCSKPPNLFGIPQSQSFSYDNSYHGQASYPFEPYNITTVDTHLAFSIRPGSFHAIGETTATLTMAVPHGLPQTIAFGLVSLVVDAKDGIHFASSTLALGTSVSYEITAVLDSAVTGNCDATSDSPAGAWAAFSVAGVTQPGDLYHTTCGVGANHMSVTKAFTSTVGGQKDLFFNFQMRSTSGIGTAAAYAESHHTVEAMNSGEVYINVLTPGVTFTSDSGHTYAPAPEPASLATVFLGGVILVAWRRRPRI